MLRLSSEEARQHAYAAILAQLAEGVIVTDAVGTIVFVNEAAAAIHGVARLDVRPNAYAETYHLYREDGRPFPSEDLPLARAVRGETVRDARWLIRRPDNREVVATGTAVPLRANGRRIGAVLTLRDITAQAVAERSAQKCEIALRDTVNRLAEHRTTEHPTGHVPPAPADRPTPLPAKPAGESLKGALQDVLALARQIAGTSSLAEAQVCAERVRASASALLALVESPPAAVVPARSMATARG